MELTWSCGRTSILTSGSGQSTTIRSTTAVGTSHTQTQRLQSTSSPALLSVNFQYTSFVIEIVGVYAQFVKNIFLHYFLRIFLIILQPRVGRVSMIEETKYEKLAIASKALYFPSFSSNIFRLAAQGSFHIARRGSANSSL